MLLLLLLHLKQNILEKKTEIKLYLKLNADMEKCCYTSSLFILSINANRNHSHLALVLVPEPLMQSVGVELQGSFQASFTLNLHDGVGAANHFNQTNTIAQ